MVVDVVQSDPYMARSDEVGNVVDMGDKIGDGNTFIVGKFGEVPTEAVQADNTAGLSTGSDQLIGQRYAGDRTGRGQANGK